MQDAQDKTFADAYGGQFEQLLVWMLIFDEQFSETAYMALECNLLEKIEYQTLFEVGKELYTRLGNVVPGYRSITSELLVQAQAAKPKTIRRQQLIAAMREVQLLKKQKPTAGDVAYVNESVASFVTKSKMREALLCSGDLWEQGRFDDIVSAVETAAHSQARNSGKGMGIDFNDKKAKLLIYTKAAKNASRKAPLDIPLLDAQMRGGLEEGNLAVVMAPAKRGKSHFLVNAGAAALTHGLNVAVATCELSERDYAQRFDARLTGIPINEIALNPTKHMSQIIHATNKLSANLHIRGWGSNTATVGDLYVWLKLLKSRKGFKPDLIIVDYADLLNTTKRKRDAPDLGEIYKALRQMAFDFNCRCWTASQSNRGSYHGKRIALQDVAEDLQKIQIADVIVGIGQTQREFDMNRSRMILLGNRLGGGEGLTVDCISKRETMEIRQAKNQAFVRRSVQP